MPTPRGDSISLRGRDHRAPDPWLTPAWSADRRLVRRIACRSPAAFRKSQRKPVGARIANLSTHGCSIEGIEPIPVGERCWIALPTLESWEATVAWSDGPLLGLDFSRPLHRAVTELVIRRANGSLPWPAVA